VKSQKVVLSEGLPNGPEREFLQAVNLTCDENPDLSYAEALKLTASEKPDLARRYQHEVRGLRAYE
jgi:hypothetical protein